MKKTALLPSLMVLLSFCLLFTSCKEKETDVSVTGVTLSQTTLTLEVGKTATLTATVAPGDATNKEVTWTSSNASIATVNAGKVTAIAAGSATITVTTKDGSKTATCAVTVNGGATEEEKVTVTFGSETWTATHTQGYDRSDQGAYIFWAGVGEIDFTNYPYMRLAGPNTIGSSTYDGNGYFFDYFETTYLTNQDGTAIYGDWTVQSGTVNVTKFGSGKVSGTGNAVMYDDYDYSVNGNQNPATKNLSITFNNVTLNTASKIATAMTSTVNKGSKKYAVR